MPIQLLSPDVSSKIAAGEVIERPASVVKELVENSLDAGASRISIDVKSGGIEYIRVADNGAGIDADQVELAFRRFATSKVSTPQDLDSITTLGFRGEALASIAAVSNVILVTKTPSADSGVRITVEDGQTIGTQPFGAAPGTAVTVRNLFKDFPARRKFLRTPATEASRIQALVTRFVLAHAHVSFRFTNDGPLVFSSSGSGDLREAISAVYGPKTANAMLGLGLEHFPEDIGRPITTGMIGPPAITRANRERISIFVNGRWVQNRMLTYALQEAYRGFLMERRFPVAVINIAVPHQDVDVNVHPSKTEVRFRHEGAVFAALQQAIRGTLTAQSPVPQITETTRLAPSHPFQSDTSSFWPTTSSSGRGHHPRRLLPLEEPYTKTLSAEGNYPSNQEPLLPKKALPALRVLGQVQNTYITAEGPDGVYLIDQHAAHERVLFERVKDEMLSRPPKVQGLIQPATVELDPRQSELIESHADLIRRLGFHVEPFGGLAYVLRGVPSLISNGDPVESLVGVLDLMAEGGGYDSWEERAAYSIACHGAIRAGKTLSQQEMSELTRQLESCRQPHTCPHGRPTMVHMSSARLEREFGRR